MREGDRDRETEKSAYIGQEKKAKHKKSTQTQKTTLNKSNLKLILPETIWK